MAISIYLWVGTILSMEVFSSVLRWYATYSEKYAVGLRLFLGMQTCITNPLRVSASGRNRVGCFSTFGRIISLCSSAETNHGGYLFCEAPTWATIPMWLYDIIWYDNTYSIRIYTYKFKYIHIDMCVGIHHQLGSSHSYHDMGQTLGTG